MTKTIILRSTEARELLANGLATLRREVKLPRSLRLRRRLQFSQKPMEDGTLLVWRGKMPVGIAVSPFSSPGTSLACRETWQPIPAARPAGYYSDPVLSKTAAWYRSTDDVPTWGGRWRSPAIMPAWAVRLHVVTRSVRVEGGEWVAEVEVSNE